MKNDLDWRLLVLLNDMILSMRQKLCKVIEHKYEKDTQDKADVFFKKKKKNSFKLGRQVSYRDRLKSHFYHWGLRMRF